MLDDTNSQIASASYVNYQPGTLNAFWCFSVDVEEFDDKAFFTGYHNHQFPTRTTMICHTLQNISLRNENYTLKLNKFVTLRDNVELRFDVLGYWNDQAAMRRMFNDTPMYMRDMHEDDEEAPRGTDPC